MTPPLTALLIDSSSGARNQISETFSLFGKKVSLLDAAYDLQAGMKSIMAFNPHIILLEVKEVDKGVEDLSLILTRSPQSNVFVTTDEKNPDWILRLIRAGASEYLTKPVVAAELVEAIKKVARQHAQRTGPTSKKGAAIAVYNPSGGMGTTTLAVNLAATLAGQGEKVALIDLNFLCGDVTTFLDLNTRYTVANLTSNLRRVDASFVTSAVARHSSGIDVLGAPVSLEEAAAITPEQLIEVIGVMRTVFDHTIIDTGGSLIGCNRAVFAHSDHILFTTVLSLPALKNAKRYLPELDPDAICAGRVKLVVNRHVPRDAIKLADAEKVVRMKAYTAIPNGYEEAKGAIHKGMPLVSYSPRSPVSRAITDLANQLVLEINADRAQP